MSLNDFAFESAGDMMRLLLAENDLNLSRMLVRILEKNKFVVDSVLNCDDAITFAGSKEYDGIILNIALSEIGGIEVIKKIRKENITVPMLVLTARSEISECIECLNAGADAYLAKPFYSGEFIARIRAMLRRKDNYTPDLLKYYGLTLNRSAYLLSYDENIKLLSGKEFQIMEMLMSNPNCIITTEQIMTHIWGWNTDADTNVVCVHISNLRKKINDLKVPVEVKYIRSAGYILTEKHG